MPSQQIATSDMTILQFTILLNCFVISTWWWLESWGLWSSWGGCVPSPAPRTCPPSGRGIYLDQHCSFPLPPQKIILCFFYNFFLRLDIFLRRRGEGVTTIYTLPSDRRVYTWLKRKPPPLPAEGTSSWFPFQCYEFLY